ncbi:hypothetical protein PF005_g27734 [Phytophthora fragariae]|uniref:Uncharacterized protein n=1 Tax=Phytophthora fragariae TaxID=53985 RepID=A0A6A3VQG6_9STRA|nr:hypothetical protein PF005_g27734 [Phytophthora fragariae]
MSAALAALYWGPAWTGSGRHQLHVRMKIDNTSAVAWLNKRSSGQPVARLYNRLISLAEFRHSFTCSAEHIPGELNTMADAGSRAWTTDHPLHRVWTNLSHSWTQVIVRPPFNDLSNLWETISADTLWLPPPPANIRPIGANGSNSAAGSGGHLGSLNPVDRPTRN